ncbi:MAG: DUF1566 domain-containing protein [Thermodesulfobacteriota bacterium]|nr:DUF1566 domain-containing protein [Thermodesulfobacteriota bacterium]
MSTTVTMTGDKSVTASFQAASYSLTVNSSNGTVTTDPDKSSYTYNEEVTLIAVPDDGYVFTEWSGDASGSSPSISLIMTADKTVTAFFGERYVVDYIEETVSDKSTGLMWQQEVDYVGGSLTFEDACDYCDALEAAGYTDWRAPRVDELRTIVDYTQYSPAFDSVFGKTISSYWSGSTLASNADDAWVVDFISGYVANYTKDSTSYVRCVRSGPYWSFDPLDYLVIKNDDVVEDVHTGLEWQRADVGVARDWSDACDYCDTLELDGHDDWRIPEVEELNTIVDYTDYGPAISTEVFNRSSMSYWSGSTNADNTDYAWVVDFYDGHVDSNNFINLGLDKGLKTSDYYVRCVRSALYRSFNSSTPLVISLAASDTSGAAPLTVDFRGLVGWGKPDYTYAWEFGDGGTSTERDPSHTFSSDGTYTVELTVTDADGNVATDTKEISVGLLDDGGTISGTIYEADGSTIADVGEDSGRIAVFTGDACGDNEDVRVSDGYPDASGHYAITGLPPGEYYIRSDLYETTYEDVWLDSNGGTADCSGALKVTVEAGEVAAGNDFYLGQTTRVEGYLYQQDGSYLEEGTSFHVKAYSGAPCGSKTYLPKTNAFNIYDGYKKYILKGLPPKTQIFLEASTRDDVYATEWWNSTTSTLECAEAEPIVLETGIDVRDKNFHLDPGSGDDDDDDSSSSGGGGGYVPPASNGTLEFTSAELSAVEGEGTLTLEVSRSDGRSGEVGVSYEVVAGGSAARDEDFSVADGTLTWEDRDDDIKTITVSILDDLVVEEAETFSLKLLNATGDASIGSVSEVEVTITDDAGEASRTPLEIYCSVTPASGMAPLDVTVTFDAAGGIPPLTYQIDYGDSETASADTSGILSHGYRETGTYQMIVTVTDSQGNQAESLHDITVSNTNTVQTMSAELSPEEKSGTVPLSVAFNTLIQGSSYPCLLVYDFGDGVTRDVILENTEDEGGTGVSHTYVQPGQYHAMVSVVDAKGRSAFSSAEIKVEKTGMDVAIVPSTYTGIAGTEGLSVSFAAEISSGMPPYTYAWHLEGGVTSDLPDPVHVFNTPGRFRVDLTVSDSQGATAAHAVEIRVYDFQKITIDPDAIHISDLDTEVVPLVKGYGSDGIWRELDAVSWQSSDPNVASVKQGRIAAVGQGATEITASYGALSAVINVEVDIQPVAIDLEPSFVSLGVDEIYTLSVYAAYADGSRKKLEDFTIDIPEESESVVKVDGHQITALSTGLAHLKVVSGANEASLVVYVAEDTLPLNISPSKVKCLPGSRVTVSIQGGTPPYRSVVGDVQGERWQVTVPGDPGEKVYTVKDSAGTVAPFTMTVLSPLTLVRSGAGTIEPGGMVYFSAGGGTPPCEWYATAGAIQSAAGNTSGASYQIPEVVGKYTVSVIDANGQSADYIVTNHPRLVLSPSQLYVAPGEQKRFSVIGGKPPYTVVTDTGKIFEDGEAFIYEAGKVKGDYEIRVSDAAGNQAGLHVQVSLPLWVSPQTAYLLPNNSKQFKLTGGVGKDEDIYIYALKGDVPAHPVNRGFEYTAPGETGQDVVMVTDSDGTHTRVEVEVISDKFFITPSRTALLQEETGYFRAVLGAGDSFAWSTEAGDILTCEESSSFIDYKAPLVKGSYALTCCDIQGNEAGAEVHVVDSTVVITPRVVYLSPEETCEFRAVFGTETYQFTYTDGSITPEKGSDDTVIYQAPGRIGEFFVTVFDSAGNQDQARVIVSSGERKPRLSDVEIHQIPLPLEKPDPSIQPMAAGSVQSGGKILDLAVDLPSYITDKDTAVPMNYYLGVLMEKAGVFFLLKPGGDVAFLDSPEPFLCNDIFTVYQRIFTEPIDLCNPGPVIPFDTYYLYVLAIESIYDPDNNLTFHPADAPYEFWQFFFEFKGCGEE